jgi:hypothetical protein
MPARRLAVAFLAVASLLTLAACGPSKESPSGSAPPAVASSSGSSPSSESAPKPNADGTIPSGTGTEKEKPAPGKANVQGKVLYNGKPASGIEVKLAEKFSRFLGNPSGETFVAKTDANGEYLIKNVTPRVYEGLLVKVFDSPFYQFATSGFVSNAKYNIEEGKTYFAPDTNLFKSDLKLLNPKAGAKIAGANIEVKWAPYPEAAYYKFSVHADSSSGAKTEYDYIDKRVDGTSYTLDKALTPGTYSVEVNAYNSNDIKLAESPDDIKFTVK